MKIELVIFVGLLVSLVFPVSGAVDYIAHDVTLLIPPMGSPVVNEVYQIKLNSTEKDQFVNDFSSNVTLDKLVSWGTGPSFKVDVKKYQVSYVLGKAGFAQVNLQYTSDNLIHKVKDLGNTEVIAVDGEDTVFYNDGVFALPMKPATQLMIQFPKSYRLAEPPQPRPTEERVLASVPGYLGQFYEYMWRGPISSDGFEIKFVRTKIMQNQFTLEGLFEEIKYRFGNPLYVVATLIILALVYIYRKPIIELLREVFAEETASEED